MERELAARVLGIAISASRGEARTAYMALLQQASLNLPTNSAELQARLEQLQAAYEAFSGDQEGRTGDLGPAIGPTGPTTSHTTHGGRNRLFTVLISAAVLLIAVIGWSVLSSPQESPSSSEPSQINSTAETSPQATPSASASPQRTPYTGLSGLVNTCWKDDVPTIGDSQKTTPVSPISCTNLLAQWRVFKETRDRSQCPEYFLTTQDGWVLCIKEI